VVHLSKIIQLGSFISPYLVELGRTFSIQPMIIISIFGSFGIVAACFVKETFQQTQLLEIKELLKDQ
jgi:hypothetical protein